jgi:hypothetical protein
VEFRRQRKGAECAADLLVTRRLLEYGLNEMKGTSCTEAVPIKVTRCKELKECVNVKCI